MSTLAFRALLVLAPLVAAGELVVSHVHSPEFAAAGVGIRPVEGAELSVLLINGAQETIGDVIIRYKRSPASGEPPVFTTYRTRAGGSAGLAPGRRTVVAPPGDFELGRNWRVTVSVDSVIFDDGLLVGPDEFDVIRREADSRRGFADVLREFVSRGGQEPDLLRKWLEGVKGGRESYQQGTAGAARELLFMMDRLKREQWVAAAELQLARAPRSPQPHR